MKKSLLAIMLLGAFGVANAETFVYGVLDEAVRTTSNINSSKDRSNQMTDGIQQGSRLGFKGFEDLGGGLKANYQLEAGFSVGTGTSGQDGVLFGRTAAVGLSDRQLGSLSVGRQTTLGYDFLGKTDVYSLANNSAISGYQAVLAGTRWNNSVKYTNKVGDFNVGADYAFGNTPGSTSKGTGYGVNVGWAKGLLDVQGLYQVVNDTADGIQGTQVGQQQSLVGLGGSYDLGKSKVFAEYFHNKFDLTNQVNDIYVLGADYSLSANLKVKGSVTHDVEKNINTGSRNTYSALVSYALSKRTDVYTSIDYNRFSGSYFNTASPYTLNTPYNPNTTTTGVSLGLRHVF